MKRCQLFFVALCCLATLIASPANTTVPQTISYQGRLTDAAGDPAPDVAVLVNFTIWDASTAGTALWNSGFQAIIPAAGLFNYALGSNVALPDNLFSDTIRYLGITIGTDPELTPRERFRTVPYAYQALRADTADISATVFDGAITGPKLAANSVNSGNIVNGTITADDLATNSVAALEIQPNAVGSSEVMDNSLTADDLASNSVGAAEIAANSVGNSEMMDNAIGSPEVLNNSLTAADLAASSVGASELANSAVIGGVGGHIVDGSITAADLATSSVGADEIQTNAVGASELATSSVIGGTGGDILDNTISSADILNSTITGADIASGSIFDIDLGDEPGVAQATSTSAITLTAGVQTLIARTLTAPTTGFVFAVATFQVNVSHSSGSFDRSLYGVSTTTTMPSNATELGISNLASSGTRKRVLTVSRMFQVGSGAITYRLLGNKLQGVNPGVDNLNLALLFFPTAYGAFSVSPPLPPDDNTKQQAQMETLEDLQMKQLDK